MHNKLLAIKQDKNILIYSISYNFSALEDYFKVLEEIYGYTDVARIVTTIVNGVPLSMNEFDYMKDSCNIRSNYKLINDLEIIDKNTKISTIEIEVEYYSKINQMLKDTFLNDEPLLNATLLIKLMNNIFGVSNNFKYNHVLDSNDKRMNWDDPRRINYDKSDDPIRIKKIQDKINSNIIKFNKKECDDTYAIIYEIVENLKNYLYIEHVGIFPISDDMSEFQKLLQVFAERNENAEIFFGSLENVNINFSGSEIILKRKEEILNAYSLNNDNENLQKRKNKAEAYNMFLQF